MDKREKIRKLEGLFKGLTFKTRVQEREWRKTERNKSKKYFFVLLGTLPMVSI